MVSKRRILFPVDFSNYPFAVPQAIGKLIARSNVEVILLHVIEAARCPASKFLLGMERLAILAQQHFTHFVVKRRLDCGVPANRLLDYIHENEIEVVVMPARDSGGLGKGPLGKVAAGILAKASCPVWLEWRSAGKQPPVPAVTPRIYCAVDGTRSAEQLLREAVVIADRLGGDLKIISSIQPRSNGLSALRQDSLICKREVLRETERIDRLRRCIAPHAEVTVAAGRRGAVIGRAVRDQQAELLITSDCTETVLAAEAICPVLRLTLQPSGTGGFRVEERREYGCVA